MLSAISLRRWSDYLRCRFQCKISNLRCGAHESPNSGASTSIELFSRLEENLTGAWAPETTDCTAPLKNDHADRYVFQATFRAPAPPQILLDAERQYGEWLGRTVNHWRREF